jgi:Asp-tRNA(Asn)/Glu-tRNA(Gln) amidotransferase A subunit family amidase
VRRSEIRIGRRHRSVPITKPWRFHDVDSECVDALDGAAKLCEDLGHHVEEAPLEIDKSALAKAIWVIITAQTRALPQLATPVLGRPATSKDVEPVTWAYAENALRFSASDYAEAINDGLQKIKNTTCPFVNLPEKRQHRWGQGITPALMKRCHWVEPVLVAQVKFTEWTLDDQLRQPVFLGLRSDKDPKEVVRE